MVMFISSSSSERMKSLVVRTVSGVSPGMPKMNRPLARRPAAWIERTVSRTASSVTPALCRSIIAGSADSIPMETISAPAFFSWMSISSEVWPARMAQLNCMPKGLSINSWQRSKTRCFLAVNKSSYMLM